MPHTKTKNEMRETRGKIYSAVSRGGISFYFAFLTSTSLFSAVHNKMAYKIIIVKRNII
jgi:hypothetical protein